MSGTGDVSKLVIGGASDLKVGGGGGGEQNEDLKALQAILQRLRVEDLSKDTSRL